MDKQRKYKQRNTWSAEHEKLVVELWGEHIEELRGTRKNAHVYEEMRLELQKYGCVVTTGEVRTKINNLSCRYRKEKQAVGISGGSPSNWVLYQDVHSILGTFKINNVQALVEESIDDDQTVEEYLDDLDESMMSQDQILDESMMSGPSTAQSTQTPVRSAGTGKKGSQAEMLKIINALEKRIDSDKAYHHELHAKNFELEKYKSQLLEEFVNTQKEFVKDQKEIKDAIINYCNHSISRDLRLE